MYVWIDMKISVTAQNAKNLWKFCKMGHVKSKNFRRDEGKFSQFSESAQLNW